MTTSDERRKPQIFELEETDVEERSATETFTQADLAVSAQRRPLSTSAGSWRWLKLLVQAIAALIVMSLSLRLYDLAISMIQRQDWFGWLALGIAGVAVFSFLILIVRELAAIIGLSRLQSLRHSTERALRDDNAKAAGLVVAELVHHYGDRPDLSLPRREIEAHRTDVLTARERMVLAERHLMSPLDADAMAIVTASAKRIATITALSPFILLDVGTVAVENLRMLRRIATLYGGRPGTWGALRLGRLSIEHIVVTTGIDITGDLVPAGVASGLAPLFGRKLGEGLFNGAMTARLGTAAIEICRPMPFMDAKAPNPGSVIALITREVGGGAVDYVKRKAGERLGLGRKDAQPKDS
ncbi:MAG: TIGR01620 family protein [Hyphomicrobiaceae bacterium]